MNIEPKSVSNDHAHSDISWSIVESLSDAILITNSKNLIVFLNNAAEQLFKLSFTSSFGKKLSDLIALQPINNRKQQHSNSSTETTKLNNAIVESSTSGFFFVVEDTHRALVHMSVTPITLENKQSCSLISIRPINSSQLHFMAGINCRRSLTALDFYAFNNALTGGLLSANNNQQEHGLIILGTRFYSERTDSEERQHRLRHTKYLEKLCLNAIREGDCLSVVGPYQLGILVKDITTIHTTHFAIRLLKLTQNATAQTRSSLRVAEIKIGVTHIKKSPAKQPSEVLKRALQAYNKAKQTSGDTIFVHPENIKNIH